MPKTAAPETRMLDVNHLAIGAGLILGLWR